MTPLSTEIHGFYTTSGKGRHFTLTAPFRYRADECEITVPVGFTTDFHSIPRGLWNILPPWEYPAAAVVHDYLYSQQPVTRKVADKIYYDILLLTGCPKWRAYTCWAGLRVGGWVAWNAKG